MEKHLSSWGKGGRTLPKPQRGVAEVQPLVYMNKNCPDPEHVLLRNGAYIVLLTPWVQSQHSVNSVKEHACDLCTLEVEAEDQKLRVILSNTLSSRTAWAAQDPVLKKEKKIPSGGGNGFPGSSFLLHFNEHFFEIAFDMALLTVLLVTSCTPPFSVPNLL